MMHNPKERLVIGNQLRKARETVQFPLEDVAQRLKIRRDQIQDWEEERSRPSLRQLELLAELYGREIDYFLKDTPDAPSGLQFRSATQRKFHELSNDARLVIAKFDELCRTAVELERLLGRRKPVLITPRPVNESPVSLAQEERNTLGLDAKPASELRDRLSGKGIRVFELVVPHGEFSGLSYWHTEYGPCILISAKDLPGRRNFTLAHEYAHLLYRHQPSVCELIDERKHGPFAEERSANVFAIEFLLPEEPVRDDFSRRGLSNVPSLQEVGRIAGKWSVSVQAMAYRLEELGLLAPGYANELLSGYEPQVARVRAPKAPRWERRLGRDFVSSAFDAYLEGHISLGKLARSLGLPLRRALETAEQHQKKRHRK